VITKKQRWMGWLGALAITLLAVRWVGTGEEQPSAPAVTSGQTESTHAAAVGTQVDGTSASDIRLDRLKREPYPALKSDLFKGDLPVGLRDSDAYTEEGKPRRPLGPPPLPPLPFAYMGKMLDDGQILVFLTRGDRNYVVRKGSTIDGQYRVDDIRERSMMLTYLPARAKQSLAIGSAP